MESNEDVDWGVIFSEASVCVQQTCFRTAPGGTVHVEALYQRERTLLRHL